MQRPEFQFSRFNAEFQNRRLLLYHRDQYYIPCFRATSLPYIAECHPEPGGDGAQDFERSFSLARIQAGRDTER